MKKDQFPAGRIIAWSGLGAAALLAGFGAWLRSLPAAPGSSLVPPVSREERDATLDALKPPKRARPLIAIVGVNEGTEVTDYLVPHGMFQRADVADVVALATKPGPMRLFPALEIAPQDTVAEFDRKHPQGADYVIVPAMHRDDDPAVLRWIRRQASSGAMVIGICAGARVVAEAGLLDGKRATTHWYHVGDLRGRHPKIRYVPDRRLVVDRGVATTTGISASIPMALTVIEAIAGSATALQVARDLGIDDWDVRHDSAAFRFTRPFALTGMRNRLGFWKHETFGIELVPGVDEVSLALVADAWSRTWRSRALTFAATADARTTRSGIRVLPDRVAARWPAARRLPTIGRQPASALHDTLEAIRDRYGGDTSDFVAMQLESPSTRA